MTCNHPFCTASHRVQASFMETLTELQSYQSRESCRKALCRILPVCVPWCAVCCSHSSFASGAPVQTDGWNNPSGFVQKCYRDSLSSRLLTSKYSVCSWTSILFGVFWFFSPFLPFGQWFSRSSVVSQVFLLKYSKFPSIINWDLLCYILRQLKVEHMLYLCFMSKALDFTWR